MDSPQISGKVFRFLSTMHPSLSKPERKRYAEFDPDKWYPWTADIAGEFTDLMRRSPRDTSFARGLAYAATKGGIVVVGIPDVTVRYKSSSVGSRPAAVERNLYMPSVKSLGSGSRYLAAGPLPFPALPWQAAQARL